MQVVDFEYDLHYFWQEKRKLSLWINTSSFQNLNAEIPSLWERVYFLSPWFRSVTCPFWDTHTKYSFNLSICPGVHFLLFSFSSRAVSNSGLIPSTWLSAFFYSWFLFFSFSFPISLAFHFLSFSARTAFYFNHLWEWSGHNELGILYRLHEGIRCGKNWYKAALKQSSEPVPAQATGQLPGSAIQPQGGNLWLFAVASGPWSKHGPVTQPPCSAVGEYFWEQKYNCGRDLCSSILANQDCWWNIYLSGLDV